MRFSVKIGLRGKLLGVMLALLALSLGAVWRVATTMGRESLVRLTGDTSAISAQSLANAIQLQIEDARADALVTARLDLVAQAIDSGDPKAFVWYADELIRTKQRYTALWVIDATGKIVAASSRRGSGTQAPAYVGNSVAQESWFMAARASEHEAVIEAGRPALLQPELQGDEFVFGFAFPVVDVVGERIGTLASFVSSRALDAMLEPSMELSGASIDAFAALVDKDGKVVTLPAKARNAQVWHDVARFARFETPLGGVAESWGWRVAELRRAEVLERPVEALSVRLQWFFIGTLVLASVASILLASALLQPIYRLTVAATRANEINAFDPIAVRGSDEISSLTTAFNAMMQTVKEREAGLESARRELQDLFNKIPSAIFLVNREGRIDPQYSVYCQSVFETSQIAGQDVAKILGLRSRSDEESISRMSFWLRNIFGADDLQWDMSSPDRMTEIVYEGPSSKTLKTLEMTYVPVYDNDVIDKVMFIARDVTELRGLAKRAEDAEETTRATMQRVHAIGRLDPGLFRAFMQETRALLDQLAHAQTTLQPHVANDATLQEMGRILHTLKGSARMFKLDHIQRVAHRCEDQCIALIAQKSATRTDLDTFGAELQQLDSLVTQFYELGQQLVDDAHRSTHAESVRVRSSQMVRLDEAVRALRQSLDNGQIPEALRANTTEVVAAAQDLRHIPLSEHLAPLREMGDDLARQLRKPMRSMEIDCGDIALDAQRIPKLLEILGHAVRNAIDHGLESANERVSAGKSHDGVVRLRCERTLSRLMIEVADDGRGIDVNNVKDTLVAKHLVEPTQAAQMRDDEVMQAVFLPGFTTAKTVTDVSGRGIGLDAVAHMVHSLGGSVVLRSQRGKSTQLCIDLPL